MKKNLLIGLAALASVTITSCQKDQVINQVPQEQAIEFGTYVGRDAQTKGSSTTTSTIKAEDAGFGVFAYYTDDDNFDKINSTLNFMKNQQVEYNSASTNSTKWEYSPVKYWPNETTDKLSFFAYAPYNSGLNLTSNTGDPKVNITVDTDVTTHVDFTYATDEDPTDDTTENKLLNQTKQITTGNIKFHFRHAMSKVGFKVEALIDQVNSESDGTTPDSEPETPENAIAAGTTISVESVSIKGNFNNSGTLNLNGGTWDNLSSAERTYTLNSTNSDFAGVATAVTVDPSQLNKDSEFIMLIPQENVDITIYVTYTVTTTDPNFDSTLGQGDGKVVVTNTMSATLNGFDFIKGNAYNFVLHLGLTSVKIDAEVGIWTENDVVVNVPNN